MKYDNIKLSFLLDSFRVHILRVSFGKISWVIPMHNHSDNCYELHYITSGRGKVILDGTAHQVEADTLFITGPLVYHEQIPDEQDPMAEYCFNLCIEPNPAAKKAPVFVPGILHSGIWSGQNLQDVGTVMKLIYREFGRDDSGSRLAITGMLQYLLVLLSRLSTEPQFSSAPALKLQQTTQFCLIEDAFLYEYRELTLEQLAARLGLSERQTERLLKKNYGSTFRQMKAKARMAAAAAALLSSDKAIGLIAEEAGYTSTEHFCRAFKSCYAVTPLDYRRKAHPSNS
ncbi:MAG: AraC family transcriptional regulator [Lachnospiraceae bacterium]